MQTKTVSYERNGLTAHVIVSEATTLIGMRRTRMQFEARQVEKVLEHPDPDETLLRIVTYPDLIAPTVEIDIDGHADLPTFEEFLNLPETFVAAWENAVYDLNAHWLPQKSEDEKKAPTTSISG